VYVKLFSDIIQSSIWAEGPDTCKLWITMLALARPNGLVRATAPGLSNEARIPLERTKEILSLLESPDPDSRTPDHEGRRIERVDGGYMVLNYTKYREFVDEDTRRERDRVRSKNYRARHAASRDANVTSRDGHAASLQAEGEAEGEAEVEREGTRTPEETPQNSGQAGKDSGSIPREPSQVVSAQGQFTESKELAQKLYDAVKSAGLTPVFSVASCSREIEKELLNKGVPVSEVRRVIDWVFQGEGGWWQANLCKRGGLPKHFISISNQSKCPRVSVKNGGTDITRAGGSTMKEPNQRYKDIAQKARVKP
jgi:hypothetical protein